MTRKYLSIGLLAMLALCAAIWGNGFHVFGRASAAGVDDVRDQLVGGWSLASRETRSADGKAIADPRLAATPKGVLIYDRSDHVSA